MEDRTLLSAPTLTYTVNIAGDNSGAAGTGTTTSTGGSGNLRWCVNQADQALLTGTQYALIQFDPIVFSATKTNTINLSNGELEISDNVTINGPGGGQEPNKLVISGTDGRGGGSRVFNITSLQANVTIAGLTVTNGNANVFYTSISGNQGGDIFNGGNLTLTNDIVTNGFSSGSVGGPQARGGGIFNAEGQAGGPGATLTLNNTLVENNLAEGVVGGNGADAYLTAFAGGLGGPGIGGGIYNDSNALMIVNSGSEIINNTALGGAGGHGGKGLNAPSGAKGAPGGIGGPGGNGGGAVGGGVFNAGILQINGSSTSEITIGDNIAQGGAGGYGGSGGVANAGPVGGAGGIGGDGGFGGTAAGGAIYNTGSFFNNSLQYVQFQGDQAVGGVGALGGDGNLAGNGSKFTGGAGGPAGSGGSGGDAQGGALYNAVGTVTVSNSQFGADAKGTSDQALGGAGSHGGVGGIGGSTGASGLTPTEKIGGRGGAGGAGGSGGTSEGGAVVNAGTSIAFSSSTFTNTLAQGGIGNFGGPGGGGGTGGPVATISKVVIPAGAGGQGGAGAPGGIGGSGIGGAIFNLQGNLSITGGTFTGDEALGAIGGVGGLGNTAGIGGGGNSKSIGGPGGVGGAGGNGGAGGAARGGGFYSVLGTVNVSNTTFAANAAGTGQEAISGAGGTGGNGGLGGQGGDDKQLPAGIGGSGGAGGRGGDSGEARGGAGGNNGGQAGDATSLTNDAITSSLVQAAAAGTGGIGGNGGDSGNSNAFYGGGSGGNGGAGGNAGYAAGGALDVLASSLTVAGSTFGGSSAALGNKVLGGTGGNGGIGGSIGYYGHNVPPYAYSIQVGTNVAGNGGAAGSGSSVAGGAVSEASLPLTNVNLLNSYAAINFGDTQGYVPPDTNGAAGPDNYVETVNQTLGIFSPKSTGALATFTNFSDFWYLQGKLKQTDATSELSDPVIVYDEQIKRFIVGDQDVDFFTHVSNFDIAVSKTDDPKSLTAADWNFYQVNTTENNGTTSIFDADYPGNMGYNADSLVFTLNMFSNTAAPNHVQVNSVSLKTLMTTGATIQEGVNASQSDFAGFSLRPTTMHNDTTPAGNADPMWFVEETNAGAANSTITVVDMTNSNQYGSAANFVSTQLNVTPYSTAVPELQPDGTPLTTNTDSRIMKAAWQNGLLVAAHQVSNTAGNLDQVQWYVIDTTGATPILQQQGDLSGGPGTYYAYPGIDINAAGIIGMSYIASGTGAGQYMSTYITGRTPTDTAGQMDKPVLVQQGAGNYHDFSFTGREGDLSGINVDSDGSFWISNEYATAGTFANWGTVVAHFTVGNAVAPPQPVAITNSSFGDSSITGGTGGVGGQAGLFSLDGNNGGINGLGGHGGDAQGGAISMAASTAQNAVLTTVTVTGSSATGGAGGNGNINYLNGEPVFIIAWNGYGSAAGDGGSVEGVGLASLNYNLNASSSSFNGGTGLGGAGGIGGGSSLIEPRCWDGGAGGAGGSAQGGGLYFDNSLKNTSLNFSYSGGSSSNNLITGGAGGEGGNAGASTSGLRRSNVAGGDGGAAGFTQGGGLYVFASATSSNTIALDSLSLLGDHIAGGQGGSGGAGYNAAGGAGGLVQGAGIYNNSTNNSASSSMLLTNSTLADDRAAGGAGGNAGSGTTPNGGGGGAGGSAGNADGAGLFNGANTTLKAYNSTFGGGSTNTTTPNANSNILIAGNGGRGGNAGIPGGATNNGGGVGGNGGTIAGGDVYISSNTATFLDDTIVLGQAIAAGSGGAGGSAAGNGGKAGNPGKAGTGTAGGYYANSGSTNTVGNTIIGINNDAAGNPDVFGTFVSDGYNLLTSTAGSGTSFNTGSSGTDKVVPATGAGGLNLGPLLNNGGSTLTDAELTGSAAIGGGANTVVPSGITADQRGFSRFYPNNTTVDVGAFEFQPPIINTLSPNTRIEDSPAFTMTIMGSNFIPGATVSFGGSSLNPLALSSTSITVLVPANLLANPGPINVVIENPDGSGLTGQGHTVTSAPATFTVSPTPFALNNPGNQASNAGDPVTGLQITPGAGFKADNFSIVTGPSPTDELPPGLTIDPKTGVISGTITTTAANTYTVTVDAFETGTSTNATVTFTWLVNPPPTLVNPGARTSNEGDIVSLQIATSTGVPATGYTISSGSLPPGLSLNSANGLISGTIDPRGAGSYPVTISPANTGGTGSASFTWTVNDTTPPSLSNPELIVNSAGDTVNVQLQAVDADSGSFTAIGLPQGLSINGTGMISGTISTRAGGNYQVSVQAADGGVLSSPITFLWSITGSPASPPSPPSPVPSPPPSPPPSPGAPGVPPGLSGLTTNTSIVSVQNTYPGPFQLETVTVDVTNSNGYVVNQGVVAVQVNGQTVYAPVHDGVATASVATGLFDFSAVMDLLFSHSLTATYSDSTSIFTQSGTGTSVQAIFIDFFMFEIAQQFVQVTQLQGS